MRISVEPFGATPDGGEVLLYTFENSKGMKVELLNFGGVIRSIQVPDKKGNLSDVVLGHETLEGYFENPGYLGAVVGRNCNRVAGAEAAIFGKSYPLEANNGNHNLHSGSGSLCYRLFSSEVHTFNNLPVLLLNYKLADLADGFPGELSVNIIYALTEDNALMIDYRAVSDKDTVINLTNHSYFNLAGHDSGTIYGHILEMNAPFYTPTGSDSIPTGEVLQVAGTPLDFTTPKPIGRDIGSSYPQLHQVGGYDHNFVLAGSDYRKIATVSEPVSGRVMEVYTDLPGVQFYTGNAIDTSHIYKNGVSYAKHQGFCLETQIFPNAVNVPWFPSPIFSAGEQYASTTTFQFSVKE